jgi:hypothetical protein
MSENNGKAVENLSYCLRTVIVELSDLREDYKAVVEERDLLRQQLIANGITPFQDEVPL